MGWTKISSTVEHITLEDFRQQQAQSAGFNYQSFTIMVAGLGVAAVSSLLARYIGPTLAQRLTHAGFGLSIASALDTYLKSPNQASLEAAVRDADLNKKKYMRIHSEMWYYESANGNSSTWDCRTTYTAY
ncbi:hypothetical protein MHH70_10755 [Metasolibacillus sp. FSL H7-0170]|uniref:hypothetical protein n=1 Tax=Metasolibacillus sp. FSL H7-0170 TaxID=2921431 RepID=UPI0031582BE8